MFLKTIMVVDIVLVCWSEFHLTFHVDLISSKESQDIGIKM